MNSGLLGKLARQESGDEDGREGEDISLDPV